MEKIFADDEEGGEPLNTSGMKRISQMESTASKFKQQPLDGISQYFLRKLPSLPKGVINKVSLLDVELPGGPFRVRTSRDGRHVLLGSGGGQISMIDRHHTEEDLCNMHVQDPVKDIIFLQDYTFFAAAAGKNTNIHSQNGTEIHCLSGLKGKSLRYLRYVEFLEYLPHHWLLVTCNNDGMSWTDASIGKVVGSCKSEYFSAGSLSQMKCNAVILRGHDNGQIHFHTPNEDGPVVKMLAHKAQVRALDTSECGRYLASASSDNTMKIYDIRNLRHPVVSQRYSASSINFSANSNIVELCHGKCVDTFTMLSGNIGQQPMGNEKVSCPSDILSIHTEEKLEWDVQSSSFIPHEDILLVGCQKGIRALIVPGSADRKGIDTFRNNLFNTSKQRNNQLVKDLLEKLPDDSITFKTSMLFCHEEGAEDADEGAPRKEEKGSQMREKSSRGKAGIKSTNHQSDDEDLMEHLTDRSSLAHKKPSKRLILKKRKSLRGFDRKLEFRPPVRHLKSRAIHSNNSGALERFTKNSL